MTARQIEAARRAITRHFRRGGQVWIRVFPDKPVTSKPAETRMGSGKGSVDRWVAVVRPGRILFEVAGIRQEMAQEALETGVAEAASQHGNDSERQRPGIFRAGSLGAG